MMKLLKGNENNLEGKVIVFCEFDGKTEEESFRDKRIFAFYAAVNLEDFVQKFGCPEEMKEEFKKQMKKNMEDIGKAGIDACPVYATPLPIEDEADLYLGDEDVVHVGKYSRPEDCMTAVRKGVEFYLFKFDAAKKKGKKEDKSEKKEIKKKEEPVKKEDYKSINQDSLKNYLLNKFVVPMLDCYRYEESWKAEGVGNDFIEFCKGAPFANDVSELVKAIGNGKKNPNIGLIEDYLVKIEAVYKEDYMTAAKIRDKISGKK